jgi:hypothetical protein
MEQQVCQGMSGRRGREGAGRPGYMALYHQFCQVVSELMRLQCIRHARMAARQYHQFITEARAIEAGCTLAPIWYFLNIPNWSYDG